MDLLNAGMRDSGVYYLQIRGTTYWFLKVYCEQEIADGGWTVSLLSRQTVYYTVLLESFAEKITNYFKMNGKNEISRFATILSYLSYRALHFYRRIFIRRLSKGGMITESREKISTEIGRIIKTDSEIPPKNFGWATRTYIC